MKHLLSLMFVALEGHEEVGRTLLKAGWMLTPGLKLGLQRMKVRMMDLFREIVEYWGDSLVTYPEKEVKKLPLSPQIKYFLQFVGLPMKHKMPSHLFGFHFLNHLEMISFREKEYISIGNFHAEYSKLCIDPETEQIIIIYSYQKESGKTRLLNSSLPSLVKFLKYIDVNDDYHVSKETFCKLMKALVNEDYKVFEDDDSFWYWYFLEIAMGVGILDDEDEEDDEDIEDIYNKMNSFIKSLLV